MKVKKEQVKYIAKKNCKQCYGRGVLLRTLPAEPKKRKPMPAGRYLCGCVTAVEVVGANSRSPLQEGGENKDA